jgi:hypothetical protein
MQISRFIVCPSIWKHEHGMCGCDSWPWPSCHWLLNSWNRLWTYYSSHITRGAQMVLTNLGNIFHWRKSVYLWKGYNRRNCLLQGVILHHDSAMLHCTDIKHYAVFTLETSGLSALCEPLKQHLRRWWFHDKKGVEITVRVCKCKNLDCNKMFNHITIYFNVWMCLGIAVKHETVVE